MKKFINVLCVLLALFICVGCLSGCNSNNDNKPEKYSLKYANNDGITPKDVVEALENAGFEGTYFDDSKLYIGSTDMYITDMFEFETTEFSEPYKKIIHIRNYSKLEDVVPVLNAIIPLWDDSFDNYGEKVVVEINYSSSGYFKYHSISFSLQDITTLNENYMTDLNDHNEYISEEALYIYLD